MGMMPLSGSSLGICHILAPDGTLTGEVLDGGGGFHILQGRLLQQEGCAASSWSGKEVIAHAKGIAE